MAENLNMGCYPHRANERIPQDIRKIFNLFPITAERSQQMTVTLSGGEQQMLAFGLAAVPKPSCCSWTSRPSVYHRYWLAKYLNF
jgi:branched-chain amino acid transport system ATP-binding protein